MIYKTMAINKKDKKYVLIESDYPTKKDFVTDIRKNGYRVNEKRVATRKGYDYIMDHTDAENRDFKIYGNMK